LLAHVDAAHLRTAVGVLLVAYSAYGLARPAFKLASFGVRTDAGIGVLNGVLGGLTGLTGIVVTIWCQLRGWPKDVLRTVFQRANLAVIVMSALAFGASASSHRKR
jgi:uncharacterized protein